MVRDPRWPGPPPDYTDHKQAWAAFPGVQEVTATGVMDSGIQSQVADCFFIHATSFFSKFEKRPNAKFNVPLAGSEWASDSNCLFQAACFAATCRLYVPRYRQMEYGGFTNTDSSAVREAIELAYGDVKRAFLYYLNQCNKGWPFILAAHS